MAEDWTESERSIIVSDYFSMLLEELKGIQVNKTFHRKNIQELLNNRSEGSIEFKHQNISAVLVQFGLPYIKGYKPRFNFQNTLIESVREYILNNHSIEHAFQEFSENYNRKIISSSVNFDLWIVPPPEAKIVLEPIIEYRRPIKTNYIEKEQNNRQLGMLGEELVLEYEKWQLIKAGKESLADKIEWVSKELGDGLGYDILSRNANGTDKYIEVKTTKLTQEAPIFFSINELNFSKEYSSNFHLYRVFNFNNNPKMFQVKGSYESFCKAEAITFKGYF